MEKKILDLTKPIREVCLLQGNKSVNVIVCLDQHDEALYIRCDYTNPIDGIKTIVVCRNDMLIIYDKHDRISTYNINADTNRELFEKLDQILIVMW